MKAKGMNEGHNDPKGMFSKQLNEMREMGFFDEEKNIGMLQLANGNVNAAIELMIGGVHG